MGVNAEKSADITFTVLYSPTVLNSLVFICKIVTVNFYTIFWYLQFYIHFNFSY